MMIGNLSAEEEMINKNLIKMMGKEIKSIFEVSKLLFGSGDKENQEKKKTFIKNILLEKFK
jgi:hypothetical protein